MNNSIANDFGPAPGKNSLGAYWRGLMGPTGWLMILLIIILGLLSIPPIVVLVQNSFLLTAADGSHGGFTWEHYQNLLANPKVYASAMNSFIFASSSTVLALFMGGLLAWIVERTNAPFRGLAYLTTIVSLGMPFILYVLAWIYLFGRAGPFNDIYRTLSGNTDMLFNLHSMPGMVMIEAFAWLPLVFLLFSATFRSANAEMEEAARMSGATLAATIRRISLQLARPALLATALFVFIRSLEGFDVPVLIGRPANINLLTSDIFFSIREVPPQMGHASAFSVVLTIVIAILMYFYSRIARNAERYATVTGKGFRPRPIDLGWARWLGGGFIVFNFIIVLALPLLALAWVSLLPFVRSIRLEAFSTLTLDNYVAVLRESSYLHLTLNTLMMAAATATITMLLMLFAGWLVARRKPGATLLDQLTTLPLLLPGIVLGVALMEIALRSPVPLYGTLGLIVIAFTIRYMPYGMRYSFSGVLQIHRELEEAAHVAGASTITTLWRIVVPLLLPALASGWLFIFLNAAKELSIAILLAGPDSQTMAVAIYEQVINGQFSELAALGLLWTLLMTAFAACFYFLMRRQSVNSYGH